MNVKTIKRISKRSVSMLLSVLMVLSLFTVCLVGTTVTAGAASLSSVTVTLKGTAASWNQVYIIIGKSNYVKSYAMIKTTPTGSTWTKDFGSSAFDFDSGYYFFSSSDGSVSAGTGDKSVTDVYNSISDDNKTGTHSSGGSQTKTDYSKAESYGWFDSTVWNYRNKDQISNNVDNKWGQANVPFDFSVYADYNTAVADWFRDAWAAGSYASASAGFTPLYQGNFRQGSSTGENDGGTVDYVKGSSTVKDVFAWFVSVANGANRLNSTNTGSAAAVAKGLTDSTLKGNINTPAGIRSATVTQNGVEIPQFSDAFMTKYNSKTTAVEWSPNSGYNNVQSQNSNYSFGTIQTKYSDLKFQFEKGTTSKGNTIYSYNAHTDGNRYVSTSSKKVKKGENVYGCINDAGNRSGQAGYYPMNKTNPGNAWDVVNCTGTRIDIDFAMPSQNSGTGYQMKGPGGYEDLTFSFAGDDDVWVYIDGYLALDLGGSHNNASGSINLSKFTHTIDSGSYNPTFKTLNDAGKTLYSGVALAESGSKTTSLSSNLQTSLKNADRDTHTMTIFYLERGTFDSNFAMEFKLPVVSDTSLSIDEKVDNSDVNTGLILDTLNSANKDIFSVNVKSNSRTDKSNDNPTAALSTDTSFVRNDVVGTGSPKIQQGASDSYDGKEVGFAGSSSSSNYVNVNAYYKWTDTATNNNTSTGTALATGDGVGVPSNGNVFLQYGQKAMFTDQFDVGTKLQLVPSTYLYKYGTGYDLNTGLLNIENKTKTDSELDADGQKKVADYYTTDIVVKNAKNQTLTPSGNTYDYTNTGTDENKKAKVTATVTNKIKTLGFEVSKTLASGGENTKHTNDTYSFELKCKKLFGEPYATAKSLEPTFTVVNADSTETAGAYTTVSGKKVIQLRAGQKAVFEGIPVDSEFEVVEVVPTEQQGKLSVTVTNHTSGASDTATVKSKVTADNENYKATVTIGTDTPTKIAGNIENSYQASKVPVLYRYFDRNIVAGKPTSKEEHYTYYLKWLDGGSSAFVDGATPGDGTVGVKTEYIRNYIVPNAETVDNIQFKYSLATDSISTNQYWIKDVPEHRSDFDTDDPFTSEDDKTAEGLQACLDDIKAKDYDGYIIIAEHKDAPAKYTVTAYYPDTVAGQGQVKKANVEFNTLMQKHTIEAKKTATYSVNGSSKECTFGYWERLVTIRNGGVAQTVWTPVTSNYDYGLRVNETTTLRAVYYYEDGGNKYKVAYGTNYSDPSDSQFELLDDVYGVYPQFEVYKAYKYNYFHIVKITVKHYDGEDKLIGTDEVPVDKWHMPIDNAYDSTDPQDGTYMEFDTEADLKAYLDNATVKENYPSAYKELIDELDEFESGYYNKSVGNDSTATDRSYDMYTRTTLNSDNTVNVQSRTRINVIFGAAGSPDTDTEITNVGYVLFKNGTAYDSSQTESQLKTLVDNGESSSTQTGVMVKSYKVKYVSTSQNDGSKYDSIDNNNEVNLTNKNRCQIVFDVKSDNKDYYTCYTFMVRKEKGADGKPTGKSQVYISDTPTNFTPSEAEYIIDTTDTSVKKEYYINKSSVSTVSGQPALGTVDTNSVVAVPGKYFTINATPLVSADGAKKGKLVKMTVGHKVITEPNELDQFISTEGCTKLIEIADYLTEAERADTTILNIIAEFEPIDNGITVRLPSVSGVNVAVSSYPAGSLIKYDAGTVTVTATVQDGNGVLLVNGNGFTADAKGKTATKTVTITEGMTDDEFTTAITPVTAPGTYVEYPSTEQMTDAHITAFSIVDSNGVTYSQGDVIPDGTTVTVSVTPATGWTVTNYTNNTKTLTVNHTDYPEYNSFLEKLIPTSTPVTYTVTINTNVNDITIGTASGTYTPSTGDPQSGASITVSVPYGTEVGLTGTLVNSTDYKFDNWTTSGNATITSATSTSTTATITGNTTITANFSKKAITVYFAFVDQENHLEGDEQANKNYAYPKDITNGGFSKPSGANDDPYWGTTNLKAYSNSSGTKYSEYMGYMSYTSGSTTHKATVYKFVISNIGSTVYFTSGNGGQQTNTATLEANKVYFASGSVSSQRPNITSNNFSSWSAITGRTITLTTNSTVDTGSAIFVLHYYGGSKDSMVVMSRTSTNHYSAIIPNDATTVQILRNNPSNNVLKSDGSNNWAGEWNRAKKNNSDAFSLSSGTNFVWTSLDGSDTATQS